MILFPRPGMRASLHYRASMRQGTLELPAAPEGLTGIIACVGRGPGPRNCLLVCDSEGEGKEGRRVVVPRGNLASLAPQAGGQG